MRVLDDLPWHMQHDYPQLLKLSTSSSCDIDSSVLFPAQLLPHVRGQVHTITAELFAAFENEYTVFAPMPNCFELFGLDFVVDEVRK